jgi:SAM-dependent methyltransferase
VTKLQDPKYLLNDQYKTVDKLNARIHLHAGFSTNNYGWFKWVFDHYNLSDECCILELGCGPGDLWLENRVRIPAGWDIHLSDFSAAMVAKARGRLAGHPHPFTFGIIDAQTIPYENGRFDAVIANHCIYHFPDRPKAFSEIRRVLKSTGIFYSTTIGMGHLREMTELTARFDTAIEDAFIEDVFIEDAFIEDAFIEDVFIEDAFKNEENPFTLDNGAAQLRSWFSDVQIHRYLDELLVTEAVPLVEYILSTVQFGLDERKRAGFTAFIESEIEANGGMFRIQKDSGMFISRSK